MNRALFCRVAASSNKTFKLTPQTGAFFAHNGVSSRIVIFALGEPNPPSLGAGYDILQFLGNYTPQ
jgi:hypothetical protein